MGTGILLPAEEAHSCDDLPGTHRQPVGNVIEDRVVQRLVKDNKYRSTRLMGTLERTG